LLWLEIRDPNVKVDMDVRIRVGAEQGRLELAGVVYSGEGHFMARIIDAEGETWYYDGIGTGGWVSFTDNGRRTAHGYPLAGVLYRRG
jgi:hypothetical protein